MKRAALVLFILLLIELFVFFSVESARAAISQPECSKVCASARSQSKSHAKKIDREYQQWRQRLGLKQESDVVRYDTDLTGEADTRPQQSAAEHLLKFMSRYMPAGTPGTQDNPDFLAYMMAKCFPEAEVDSSHARLSTLAETVWVAGNVKIEKNLTICR